MIVLFCRMCQVISNKSKYILNMTKKLVAHSLDMFKDTFVILGISTLIGSRDEFFLIWVSCDTNRKLYSQPTTPHFFFLKALGSLIATMVVGYLLGTFNLAKSPALYIFKYDKKVNFLLKALSFPLLPFLLIILDFVAELKLKFGTEPMDQRIQRQRQIRCQTADFIRTELGLETTPQMLFTLLLIFVSSSTTRIIHGLDQFDDTRDNLFTEKTGISPIYLVILSNGWSLFSSWRSFIRCLSATKSNISYFAQAVLGLYVVMAIGNKVSSCILFLMPALGIGNCLRHYQGELFPYWAAMGPHEYHDRGYNQYDFNYNVNVSTDEVYFSNLNFSWSEFTRFDYSNKTNPIPPQVTIYTYFKLNTYLISFWIILAIQAVFIVIIKKIANPEMFAKLEWNLILTNALENIWLQGPFQDWDSEHTTLQQYKRKQRKNAIEMGCVIFINMLFCIIMLAPMWILSKFT